MNVIVTREEIDQTKQLLDMLRQWEPIVSAGCEYDRGIVTVAMTGNTKGKVEVDIDRGFGNRGETKNAVELCEREIRHKVRCAIEKLAEDVCHVIKKHMPIQLGESVKS